MFGFLKHLFIPHAKNNHRAKILHNSSLLLIVLFFLGAATFAYLIKTVNPQILGVSYSISETDLINLVNNQRASNGLPALSEDSALDDAARRKAADMFAKNYWAHYAPDGQTSPWGFIRAAGYNYIFAGENLAKGFTDPNSVVNAWMNSSTHRDNILSSKYREVGFAIVPGTLQGEDTVLIVEMFGARSSPTLAKVAEGPPAQAVQTVQAAQTVQVAPPESTPGSNFNPVKVVVANVQNLKPTPVQQTAQARPKLDAQITSKAASTVGLSFLGFAFIMDLLIVERKKIPRIVGHNLDHVILILLFLLFIVLRSSGATL